MDESTYKVWWPLHIRVAKGESLTTEERATYESGLKLLHEEEVLTPAAVEELRKTRERITKLRRENSELEAKLKELDAEYALLESQLDEPTRQLLHAGD